MPLHDWTDLDNWDGLHHLWMTEVFYLLRRTLPLPFRVLIGSSPQVAIGGSPVNPDLAVTNGRHRGDAPHASTRREPDAEVAVTTLEPEDKAVQVERNGRLVAAVEFISPWNKDRPDSRDYYATRYLNYLRGGVHLLVVDVHRRPLGFSFPQLIAAGLEAQLPAPAAPCSVVYQVGGAAAFGGRMVAVWADPLTIGQPLPTVSLPLDVNLAVPIDLEETYVKAAEGCYLE